MYNTLSVSRRRCHHLQHISAASASSAPAAALYKKVSATASKGCMAICDTKQKVWAHSSSFTSSHESNTPMSSAARATSLLACFSDCCFAFQVSYGTSPAIKSIMASHRMAK